MALSRAKSPTIHKTNTKTTTQNNPNSAHVRRLELADWAVMPSVEEFEIITPIVHYFAHIENENVRIFALLLRFDRLDE
jgi:hypothetical protein